MAKKQRKKGKTVKPVVPRVKDFLDMIAPAAVKFNTDSYVLGSSFRCTLALRSYPTTTEELALLCHLGEKSGVALHIYIRQATAGEEDAIIHNAQNKNRMDRGNTNNMRRSINAEANLQDVESLITTMRRNKEPLVHCAVFIELCARDADGLRALRDEVSATLTRSKLSADRLFLVQRNGFLASNPAGNNVFASQFERVLPASSVANLFPFNYSGKNDPNGFYIGRDRYGSNIILDLDRRAEDKTNANVLILGNSGQGKSFLLKLLLCNILGLNDHTDFQSMRPEDFPILSDLYEIMEDAYQHYEQEKDPLYPKELLQEVLLGLHSMCKGAESKFFNGHTNVTSHRFLVFGVKDLINGSLGVRNAMLFNLLSYLSDKLLTEGNTVAGLDELYIWLSNPTAVEYIRNTLKRVRKKESSLIMASQNLEDFDVPGVREMTRPLFAIPTHQFLFNAGNVDKRFYMDNLQLEASEFELIAHPQNGVCLFKCGNERYLLEVHAPEYIRALFGEAGGR